MLFKQKHLEGIQAGTVTLAFRRWKKAAVLQGSLVKTSIGLVEIEDISTVDPKHISAKDAQQAGFDNREDLMKMLDQYTEGDYYRIKVRYHDADPRIALREQAKLDRHGYEELSNKLTRLDPYSKTGPWTREILKMIETHPRLKAADLALLLHREKEWLKLNIRKLKNLGLTISHDPGYEIAPLGKAFLEIDKRSAKA